MRARWKVRFICCCRRRRFRRRLPLPCDDSFVGELCDRDGNSGVRRPAVCAVSLADDPDVVGGGGSGTLLRVPPVLDDGALGVSFAFALLGLAVRTGRHMVSLPSRMDSIMTSHTTIGIRKNRIGNTVVRMIRRYMTLYQTRTIWMTCTAASNARLMVHRKTVSEASDDVQRCIPPSIPCRCPSSLSLS